MWVRRLPIWAAPSRGRFGTHVSFLGRPFKWQESETTTGRYQAEGSTVVGCSSRAQSRLSGIVLCSLSGCREHGSRWGQWLGIMPSPRHHRDRLSITFINPVVVRITVFIIFTVWPVAVKVFCSGCLGFRLWRWPN